MMEHPPDQNAKVNGPNNVDEELQVILDQLNGKSNRLKRPLKKSIRSRLGSLTRRFSLSGLFPTLSDHNRDL